MFSWRKKKKELSSTGLPPAEVARLPVKPALPGDPTLEEQVLAILAGCVPGVRLEGEQAVIPECGLTMQVRFPQVDGPRFRMEVRLEHPDFFEPLVESVTGFSEKDRQKARVGAYEILNTVLAVLPPALRGEGEELPEVALWGRTHRFRAKASDVLLRGAKEPPENRDLWSRMRESVLPYLGSKPVYWVKLFLSNTGDGTSCEARINGWVVPELTERLTALAREWPLDNLPMKSAKQYIALVQEGETRVECPYTWKQARNLTRRAIDLFESGMDYDRIPQAIGELTAVPSLAEDVFSFLPELMTKALLPEVRTFSQLQLCPKGEEPVCVYFTQCRSWDPIHTAVREHLQEDQPGRDKLMTIVGTSAMSHALSQALKNGSEPEDLILYQSFFISDSYELW